MKAKIVLRLGDFFRKLSRFFYSHSTGVCWNCGARCGMNSVVTRGLLWCDNCYLQWKPYIPNRDFLFGWRYGIGYSRRVAEDKADRWSTVGFAIFLVGIFVAYPILAAITVVNFGNDRMFWTWAVTSKVVLVTSCLIGWLSSGLSKFLFRKD